MFAYPDSLFWCAFADPSIRHTDSVMAAALAADPEDDELLFSSEWRRADALLRTGKLDAAIAADEELLRAFGQSIVTQSTAFPAWLIRELVIHLYHQLLGRWVTGTRRPELHWQDVTAARYFGRLAYAYARADAILPAIWAHLRELNLAEKFSPTPEMAHALSQHAILLGRVGFLRRARHFATRALELHEKLGCPYGVAQSSRILAAILDDAGQWDKAIEIGQRAVTQFASLGKLADSLQARSHVAEIFVRFGRLAEAAEESHRVFEAARSLGDRLQAACALRVWTLAIDGDLLEKVIPVESEGGPESAEINARLQQVRAIQLLRLQQPRDAISALNASLAAIAESRDEASIQGSCLVWLATAYRVLAEQLKNSEDSDGQSVLRQARHAARAGLRFARRHPNELPHALRECGAVAALDGNASQASRYFEESLFIAKEKGASFQYAQTMIARGRLGKRFGWTEVEDDLADGEYMARWLRQVRGTATISNLETPDPPPSAVAQRVQLWSRSSW